jgi:hypothetical protein
VLEGLSNEVNKILTEDVRDLDNAVLHEAVVTVQREIDRLSALQAQLLATWDARKIWGENGSKSPGHRYAHETGLSIPDAKHRVSRARQLSSMPLTAEAFANGELSTSRVDLLVRTNQSDIANIFARDEDVLLNAVKTLSFDDASRAMKYWQQQADPDGAEDKAEKLHDGRNAHIAKTLDNTVDLQATFDPIGGEIFRKELQRLDDELFEQDWAKAKALYGDDVAIDKLERTPAQRRCDALVLMAKRSASAAGGSNKPLISILVGEESFKNICETASGVVLTPGQVIPHLNEAHIESIIFDGKSRVIDIKHKRLFTGALRQALDVRDRHCQHPSGCDVPASKCQGDHVFAYSKGGLTELDNGQLLCAKHNRVKGTGPP